MSTPTPKIGVIGGSGLYKLDAFQAVEEIKLTTPFGDPSDAYIIGELAGQNVAFLPRHARGHKLLPSELPHRANIYGFKELGVEWIIGIGAVGSLQERYAPGHVVLPDQFFDRTKTAREQSFFGEGIVAHLSMGHPICANLQGVLSTAAAEAGATVHTGGTYVNMEGPAFSTKAESESYRAQGFDIIGMTNMFEAKLAREAEIAYANVCMITDYDCWHPDHDSVTVEMVIEWLSKNTEMSQKILLSALPRVAELTESEAHSALKFAILTHPSIWPEATAQKLAAIISKYKQ